MNGTLLNEIAIPQPSINFTSFLKIYERSLQHPADPTNAYIPAQRSLTIYNSSRLYINLERCVNTLKGECRQFQVTHGRDGDNQTAQSRYPCYYNKVRNLLRERFRELDNFPLRRLDERERDAGGGGEFLTVASRETRKLKSIVSRSCLAWNRELFYVLSSHRFLFRFGGMNSADAHEKKPPSRF